MAAPVPLNITVSQNAGGGIGGGNVSVIVVTVPISQGLQSLDSGNSSGAGQVSQLNSVTGIWSAGQTGFSSVDEAVRNIYRGGGFTDGQGTWYASGVIQKITWT
jgi:hypothetical protein